MTQLGHRRESDTAIAKLGFGHYERFIRNHKMLSLGPEVDMRRREFLGVLGAAGIGWPLAAAAQQPERMRHIGLLMAAGADDPEYQARMAAFQQGLEQLGWTEGRNARIAFVGPRPTPTKSASTPANWPPSRRTSSWLLPAPQPLRRCWRRPAPCGLCSSL